MKKILVAVIASLMLSSTLFAADGAVMLSCDYHGDVHESIYFAGLKSSTALPNTCEFDAWLDEERPSASRPIAVPGGSTVIDPAGGSGILTAQVMV